MDLKTITLDTDTTVHTLFGHQMGGRKGYNPKNKGKKSYQPILTFLAETREYIGGELRNGDRPTGRQIARHVEEAQARWPLLGVAVIHRYGRLVPGDNIVLVVTTASHRGHAFAAAEFLMDYLKTRAPFWKQEERPDGTAWVEAKSADDISAGRWAKQRQAAE